MKVAVVGRGLMGAAAARHLARGGHQVVLIGPDEPADLAAHQGVFGSHYDEGRISRRNALSPFWARAASQSIARYNEIEAQSGIRFFTASGALMAGTLAWIARVDAAAREVGVESTALDPEALAAEFPFLRFDPRFHGRYEPGTGHISPRRLVAAQTEAARRAGAEVIAAEATAIGEGWVDTGASRVEADRVLVAAGAWSDHLLGREKHLSVMARTVAFLELDEGEAARLARMPSIVPQGDNDPYILPPIRYPDGGIRLKIGGDPEDRQLQTPKAIGDWFRSGGNPELRDDLAEQLANMIPGLKIARVGAAACVTSWTSDGEPEIRALSGRVVVCTGGNGSSAKCSDELGRRASVLVTEGEEKAA